MDFIFRKISYIISVMLIFFVTVFLSACEPCRNISPCSTLCENRWVLMDTEGKEGGSLCFDGDMMSLSFDSGGEKISVKEKYIADDERIVICYENCPQSELHYTIKGDTLSLDYMNKTVTLKKKGQ